MRSVVSAKRGRLLLAGSAFAADSKADLCLVTGGDSVGRIEWTSMHFSHELEA